MIVEARKLKEQTRNVIENKGPLWKTREQTGNRCETRGLCRSPSRPCFRIGSIPLPAFARMIVEARKLKEQSRNVIENKGPLWKTRRLSGNVYENKGLSQQIRECC
jgi:hypothetical protein